MCNRMELEASKDEKYSLRLVLPEDVSYILHTLQEAGFEAYAVGGCVRDSLMGKTPQDWDITTSARPDQVKRLFGHTIDTGIAHGTVTVMRNRVGYEVTTYRVDGAYEDARHPSEVTFTGSLLEDLKRRDFTINAMAYNEMHGLVDAFDGLGDLIRRQIRCVGDAQERFSEDALRMLRAVRFAAQLGFEIARKTRRCIPRLASSLKRISAERIQAELVKLLLSPCPQRVRTLYETGISREIFPWLDAMFQTPQNNAHHCFCVGDHTMHALKHIPADRVLRLAILFHDVGKPACIQMDERGVYHFPGHHKESAVLAKQIMRQLKFDCDTIDRVTSLVYWHDDKPSLIYSEIRKAMYRIGLRQYPSLFLVKEADVMGKSRFRRKEKLAYIEAYREIYQQILANGECVSLKQLAVNGHDLIAAGRKPGKELGELLERLLLLVLNDPKQNTKEILLQKAAEWE